MMGRRVHRHHALAEQHRHFALVPIFGGTQLDAFEFLLAREILLRQRRAFIGQLGLFADDRDAAFELLRAQHHTSEEHTYELQSLMRYSYAVFRLTKKTIAT